MIISVQLFAAEVYNCFASVSAVFSDHSTEFQHLRTNATIKQDELQIIAGNTLLAVPINKVLCIDKTECSGHYTEYEITTTEGSTITVDTVRF